MSQKVVVSIVFVSAMFMNVMDITIVNVALPTIGTDLHVKSTAVSAVSIGYLVSLAVVIPASGWLGAKFGHKRVLITSIVIFTIASVLCGVAQTFAQLVLFRVLQGVGGGMLAPVGMAMLFSAFPPAERIRASSILSAPVAVAPAIGPVLGGILVTNLSWRWVFFVNLPLGMLAVAFGVIFLKDDPAEASGDFDLVGFLLSGVGFAALMYGISEGPQHGWSSATVSSTLVVGVVLIAVLIRHQLRKHDPILRLRLFGDRLFRAANVVIFMCTAGFLGGLYLIALFLQDGLHTSALTAGLATFPEALGVMAGAQLTSRFWYVRVGPRRLIAVGLTTMAIGMCLMTFIDNSGQLWWLRAVMVLLGFSAGHVFVPSQACAFARISPGDIGYASTLFNSLRQLGGAVGVAVLTTALTIVGVTHQVGSAATPNLRAYHVAFLVAAGTILIGAVAALTIHDADADATRVRRRAPDTAPESSLSTVAGEAGTA
jgi:EmrB/QacA subfamily drug resistance transporter